MSPQRDIPSTERSEPAAEAGEAELDGEAVPLARLFAMALRALIDELHERLARRGWPDVRPYFGFTLLAVRDGDRDGADPATVVSLAGLLGVTKQAASKLVTTLEDVGYVRRVAHGRDGRAKAVTLTERGAELLVTVEEVYAELEAEWAAVLGGDRVDGLRRDLLHVLRATNGGTLPAIRPAW
jgi:DNA-binding MarR family transcriptional regulator